MKRALAAAAVFAASLFFVPSASAFSVYGRQFPFYKDPIAEFWHYPTQVLDLYWYPLGQHYYLPPEIVYYVLRGHDPYPPPPLWVVAPEVPAAWEGYPGATYALPEEYAALPPLEPGTGDESAPAEGGQVAAADFNGDGVDDQARVNYFKDSLTVVLEAAGGGEKKFRYGTGSGPSAITTADFNGDGIPDLAVANSGSDTLTVFIGKGNGGFVFAGNYRTGARPKAVTAADVNGDGVADLIAANFDGKSISVLPGAGDGTFMEGRKTPVDGSPKALAVADFDSDGKMDVAASDWLGSRVFLLFGDGKGGFGRRVSVAAGHTPESIAAADINLDGKMDLVVSSVADGCVGVLYGKGDGAFGPYSVLGSFPSPRAVAVATPSPDGLPVVAVTEDHGDLTLVRGGQMAEVEVSFDPKMGSVSPKRGSYRLGSSVVLDATAKPGYRFAGWKGPVVDRRLPVTSVKVGRDLRVEAVFVRQ